MNKKALIAVIAVVLLAGAGYYLWSRNLTATPTQTVGNVVKETAEWAKAIESGRPTICTITREGNSMQYYLEGKKMRADITNVVEGKSTLSHLLNDGAYLYIWTDGETQGSKTAIPSEEELKSMADDAKKYQDETKNTPDFSNESGYDQLKAEGYTVSCNGVATDSSKLVPPPSVNFIDPTEIMKKVAPTGDGGIDMEKLQEMAKQYQDSQ